MPAEAHSTNRFNAYRDRLSELHGEKFSDAHLSAKFAPYFGQRIEVRFSCGTVKRGFVNGSRGWRPSLMLLLRRDSTASSWLLNDKDELLRVFDDFR